MAKRRVFVFVLVLFLLAVSAGAVTIVEVEGVITSIEECGGYSFDDSIQVGTTFTETYYFSNLTDSTSAPDRGDYAADYSVTLIGNYVFTSSEVGMSIEYKDFYSGYFGRADFVSGNGIVYIDSVSYECDDIDWLRHGSFFQLKSNSYIPDTDEFPSSFPDLAVFGQENLWRLVSNVEANSTLPDGIYVDGEITSIEVIPEPCTVLFLGVGGMVVMGRRRRKVGFEI